MAYNKAKEEYRWNQWKTEEEKILREQGVDEETIQKLGASGGGAADCECLLYRRKRSISS